MILEDNTQYSRKTLRCEPQFNIPTLSITHSTHIFINTPRIACQCHDIVIFRGRAFPKELSCGETKVISISKNHSLPCLAIVRLRFTGSQISEAISHNDLRNQE